MFEYLAKGSSGCGSASFLKLRIRFGYRVSVIGRGRPRVFSKI